MTSQKPRQPARLGPAPSALGGKTEIVDEPPRDRDARLTAGIVVIVKQSEIKPGAVWAPPIPERRVVRLVGSVLGHGNMEEVDPSPGGRRDAAQHFDQDGRILRLHQMFVAR